MNAADVLEMIVETIDERGHAKEVTKDGEGRVCLMGALSFLRYERKLILHSDLKFALSTLKSVMPFSTHVTVFNDDYEWSEIRDYLLNKAKEFRNLERK